MKSFIFKYKYIFLHFLLVIALVALDQLSKYSALHFLTSPSEGSLLGFSLQAPIKNDHLIFGLDAGSGRLLINTFITAVLCLCLFYYALSLVFIPKALSYLQIGISILFSGFTSNLINAIAQGYVLDFIKWSPSQTIGIYFNLADIFQTIAWPVILLQFFLLKKYIWKEKEKRKRLLVMTTDQFQFIGYSALTFFCISTFFLILNYQFLGFIEVINFSNIRPISNSFFKYSFFMLLLLSVFVGTFFLYLSNKIYGPIYAFEKYVKALLNGENPKDLRLRKHDQFKHLEDLAKDIKENLKKPSGT